MTKLMTLECGSRGTQRNRVIHAEQRSFDAIAAIRFFIFDSKSESVCLLQRCIRYQCRQKVTTVVLLSADKVLCRKKFRYPQISHIESLRRSINTKNGNASGRCPFTTSSKHEVRDHNSALKKHNQNQEKWHVLIWINTSMSLQISH
ncbi:unnamed protein product [Albugo candida]|uniref:Uncharacterized protein n=1 Tax=Albugo candida TaxID=65357 RepID=A0A024FW36_9STRA|nr:unnamed protein product [Albugo candida]|eukprot:CCI11112.1 unnamed protein product [Albugo candida]